jgi:CDP-diacylglycerol--serine O-phosphatidyltransferase
MMVSTIPTYSGKLLGERVGREWVMPIFVVAVGLVALLFTYPYETLTALTVAYLIGVPFSWRAYRDKIEAVDEGTGDQPDAPTGAPPGNDPGPPTGRVFSLRSSDSKK